MKAKPVNTFTFKGFEFLNTESYKYTTNGINTTLHTTSGDFWMKTSLFKILFTI